MAEQTDWYERGCSRGCRNRHTEVWGWCELAVEPKPTLNLHTFEAVTASDGMTSVVERRVTVEEAEAELAKFRPEPDWADVREAARKAGWTYRMFARDWHVWTNKDASVHLRRRWDSRGWKVTLAGEFGDLVLNQPTAARFAAIARLVGIGGDRG